MNLGGNIIETDISFANLLNPSDPEESGADVILWMGPKKEPIYAHSNILRNASDYYKAAFSSRWNKSTRMAHRGSEKNHGLELMDESSDTCVAVDEVLNPAQLYCAVTNACQTHSNSTSVDLTSEMHEIHYPEYEKRHMIQVLHYMYRVPTTLETKDIMHVAVIANHLLVSQLQEQCLQYLIHRVVYIHNYAYIFRLYVLLATVFLDSHPNLMELIGNEISRNFDRCLLYATPDLASLGKREFEALIANDQFKAKQKWILLIVWAMASTGMMDKTSENPVRYVFKDLSWKDRVNELFTQTVKDLVHHIHFVEFNASDYTEYVEPLKDLVSVLEASWKGSFIASFEVKSLEEQDPQLTVVDDPMVHVSNMLKSFPTPLPKSMKDYIIQKIFSSRGERLAKRRLEAELESDTIIKNGVDCRAKLSHLKCNPDSPPMITVHVLTTVKYSSAVVIVDAIQNADYMIYRRNDLGHVFYTLTQTHGADRANCRQKINGDCRDCPTYIEIHDNKGRVQHPCGLQNEQMQDYVIYYLLRQYN